MSYFKKHCRCLIQPFNLLFLISTLFLSLGNFSNVVAKDKSAQDTRKKAEYNYNAVCLFIDLMMGLQLPKIDDQFLLDKGHVKSILTTNLKQEIKHFENNIEMYTYSAAGVHADFVKTPSAAFYTEAHFSANKLPNGMSSKKYLLATFQIKNLAFSSSSLLLGCDDYEMELIFKGEKLDALNITSTLSD